MDDQQGRRSSSSSSPKAAVSRLALGGLNATESDDLRELARVVARYRVAS
jgi:hypothetical protein